MALVVERSDFHECRILGKNRCVKANRKICRGLFQPSTLPKTLLTYYPPVRLPRIFRVERVLGGGKSGAIVLRGWIRGVRTVQAVIMKVYLDAFDSFGEIQNERPFRDLYTQCALGGEPGFNCTACFGVAFWPTEWVSTPRLSSTASSIIDERFLSSPPPSRVLFSVYETARGTSLMNVDLYPIPPERMAGLAVEIALVWQRAQRILGPDVFAHYDLHPGNIFVDMSHAARRPLRVGSTRLVFPYVGLIDFDLVRSRVFPHPLTEHKEADQSLLGLRERTIQFVLKSVPWSVAYPWFVFLILMRRRFSSSVLVSDYCHLLTYGFIAYMYQLPVDQRTDRSAFESRSQEALVVLSSLLGHVETSGFSIAETLMTFVSSGESSTSSTSSRRGILRHVAELQPLWSVPAMLLINTGLEFLDKTFPRRLVMEPPPLPTDSKEVQSVGIDVVGESILKMLLQGKKSPSHKTIQRWKKQLEQLARLWDEWKPNWLEKQVGSERLVELTRLLDRRLQIAMDAYYHTLHHFVTLDNIALEWTTSSPSASSLFKVRDAPFPRFFILSKFHLKQHTIHIMIQLKGPTTLHLTFQDAIPRLSLDLEAVFYFDKTEVETLVVSELKEQLSIKKADLSWQVDKVELVPEDKAKEILMQGENVAIRMTRIIVENLRGFTTVAITFEWSSLLTLFGLGGWTLKQLLPFLRGWIETIIRQPHVQIALSSKGSLQFVTIQVILSGDPHPCIDAVSTLLRDKSVYLPSVIPCVSDIQAMWSGPSVLDLEWFDWLLFLGPMRFHLLFVTREKEAVRVVSRVPLLAVKIDVTEEGGEEKSPLLHINLLP